MIRVRFAPSPTGYLHVGGARTALYNCLFARQKGGKFILRIEDTDRSRSADEAIKAIMNDLGWLGLDWDEGPDKDGSFGPYRQTERVDLYQGAVHQLVEEKKAYLCFCFPEELKERREKAIALGKSPAYDRRCRDLTPDQVLACQKEGRKPSVRIAAPMEGQTVVEDLIKGKITFDNINIDDYVLLRSDGTPTYNLAVVIDDETMDITHVIRGDDHLSNTPRQLILYDYLGYTPPKFAHLPMIMGPDKQRLSKRHGATAIEEFRKEGFLPGAMLNYLALLGWGYDEKTTFFTPKELIEKFSLEKVSKNPAIWDPSKLEWMNGHYIRQRRPEELTKEVFPFLKDAGLIAELPSGDKLNWLNKVVALSQERIKTLREIVSLTDFFFKKEIEIDKEATEKFLTAPEAQTILKLTLEKLAEIEEFKTEKIEKAFRQIPEELQIKPKVVFQTIRATITGKTISPPLFESIELLGHDLTVERIFSALKKI